MPITAMLELELKPDRCPRRDVMRRALQDSRHSTATSVPTYSSIRTTKRTGSTTSAGKQSSARRPPEGGHGMRA